MSVRIEQIGNSIVILDTDTGLLLGESPRQYIYFDSHQLENNNRVQLRNIEYLNNTQKYWSSYEIGPDLVDKDDVPYTVTSWKIFARNSLGAGFTPAGQIYTNLFNNSDDLVIEDTNGTITFEAPIGQDVPNVTNAATIDYDVAGDTYIGIDLGRTYEELYIQYYVSITSSSTATSYTQNFHIGQTDYANANNTVKVEANHSNATDYRFFGNPTFQSLNKYGTNTQWVKIGLHINRVAQTVDYYYNGILENNGTTNDRDLQFIKLGGTGDNVTGYKLQFAAITVNELGFQDIINNSNGVGEYKSFYVDPTMLTNTNYNGVDLTLLDQSDWTGVWQEPYDPDGGTNYIDGPKPYVNNIHTLQQHDKNSLSCFKRGTTNKCNTLASVHNHIDGVGGYTADYFMKLDAYGTGAKPILDMAITADSSSWVSHDAPNNIYRQTITDINRLDGCWVDESYALSITETYTDLETNSGLVYEDGTDLYIRMQDDSDPSLSQIDVCTNIFFVTGPYCEINNIHFRMGKVQPDDYSTIQDCEGSKGVTYQSPSFGTLRRTHVYDQWAGKVYSDTIYIGSNDQYGVILGSNSKTYHCSFEDCYVGAQCFAGTQDALFAFNVIKNTIVNTLQISGAGTGSAANPNLFINNTLFHSPRHLDNDPYDLTTDSPGHGYVVQLCDDPSYVFLNNLVLLHYNENINTTSVMNSQSILDGIAGNIIDYGCFFYSATTGPPTTEITDLVTNGTSLNTNFGITGQDGIELPHANSTLAGATLPITQADSNASSGKWLATDPTPVTSDVLGAGFEFDFTPYGITEDASGNPLTSSRNIGSH